MLDDAQGGPGPPEESTRVKNKIYRLAFVFIWFVLMPLGLTLLTISSLSDPYANMSDSLLSGVRWFVTEQKVPALIVFFVLYETILYGLRYNLPFSAEVGVAGRPGLPKECRREFEAASQLLDEVGRLIKLHKQEVDSTLAKSVRDDLDNALSRLAHAMDAKEFDRHEFHKAHDHASTMVVTHLAQWQRGEVREYTESILIAVGVALLLRAFVVEAFKIPSGSMLPTLQISDHIFVNKLSYGPNLPFSKTRIMSDLPPRRGDVVVFEYPDENLNNPRQNFIKRAIALPGDILETRGGHPVINGWEIPSCRVGNYSFNESTGYPTSGELFVEFFGDYSYLTLYEHYRPENENDREGPYHVRDGEFWVLGDNRNSSSDSRRWNNGRGAGVPFANVKGRALFVWLSFNEEGNDALGVTWDRLFTNVMGNPRLPKEADPKLTQGIGACLAKRPMSTLPPAPGEAQLQAAQQANSARQEATSLLSSR